MTRDEALDWLESNIDTAEESFWCMEWMSGSWLAYEWFGPAGEDRPTFKGTLVECVTFVQSQIASRPSPTVS